MLPHSGTWLCSYRWFATPAGDQLHPHGVLSRLLDRYGLCIRNRPRFRAWRR
jgi:hypothetical protein